MIRSKLLLLFVDYFMIIFWLFDDYCDHLSLDYLRLFDHDFVSHANINMPSASPRSARSVFERELADPDVTQYLTVTGAQIPSRICYVCSFGQPNALMDTIVGSDLK